MSTSLNGYRGPTGLQSGTHSTGNIIPKGYQMGQLQQFTPEQLGLFSRLFSQVGPESYLSRLAQGDESQFQALEAPALKQFGNLQAGIASKYSQMGMGARKSSGFMNEQNQAAQDFAQALQAQRMGLQRQALMDLMGISESLLGQRPYQQYFIKNAPKKPSFLERLLGIGLPAAGAAGGGIFGGLEGAKLGGQLGAAGSEAFWG